MSQFSIFSIAAVSALIKLDSRNHLNFQTNYVMDKSSIYTKIWKKMLNNLKKITLT